MRKVSVSTALYATAPNGVEQLATGTTALRPGGHQAVGDTITTTGGPSTGSSDPQHRAVDNVGKFGWGARWTQDASFAFRTFVWMGGFLLLAGLIGYLAAISIFIPAFLLLVARARIKTTIIYTIVFFVLMLALPSLLPIDLPQGLLTSWL